MMILEILLYLVGGLLCLIGWIMMIIKGFNENPGWGIGTIFFPIVGVIFGVMHWETCKQAMKIWFTGMAIIFVALIAFFFTAAGAINEVGNEMQRQQMQEQKQEQERENNK